MLWPIKWGLFKLRALVVCTLCFDLRHAHILSSLVNDKLSFFLLAELERLSDHFQLLSALPVATKSSLLQNITKVMEARSAVSSLQSVVSGTERLCQHRDVLYQSLFFFFKAICLPNSAGPDVPEQDTCPWWCYDNRVPETEHPSNPGPFAAVWSGEVSSGRAVRIIAHGPSPHYKRHGWWGNCVLCSLYYASTPMKAMTGGITSPPIPCFWRLYLRKASSVFLHIWLKFPLGIKDGKIGF